MKSTLNPEAYEATLYPYQETGHKWLSEQRNGFIGDEMGLGKTIQAIYAADKLKLRTLLVIVPSVVLFNWRAEFEKFSLYHRNIFIVSKGRDVVPKEAEVVIITHDLIRVAQLGIALAVNRRWDAAIVDEADAFKNREAKRTVALYGHGCTMERGAMAAAADRVWLLSGTPARNDPSELWTHLRALRPDLITDPRTKQPRGFHSFINFYCDIKSTHFGPKVSGTKRLRLPELRDEVIKPFILRRLKRKVLPDLPSIRYDTVSLSRDHITKEVLALEDELSEELVEFIEDLESGVSAQDVLKRMASDEDQLSRLRRLMGILKVTPTLELVADFYLHNPKSKLVIMAHHKAVLTGIMEGLAGMKIGAVRVDGSVSASAKFDAVQTFQNDPDCRAFVGQLQAASVGTTLTAASDLMLVEGSWVPAENAQAAARVHRIGQSMPVRIQFLCLAGSIDELITKTLARKTAMIREVFGATLPTK